MMTGLALVMVLGAAQAETPASSEARSLLRAMGQFTETEVRSSSGPWWETIPDPTLPGLMADAFKNNSNMRVTNERIILAKASTWQSLAGLLPTVSLDLQGQVMPTDGLGLSPQASSMPDYGAAFQGLAEMVAQMAEMAGQDPAALPSIDTGDSNKLPDTYRQGSIMLNATLPVDISSRTVHSYLASRHESAATRGEVAAQRVALSGQVAGAWYDLIAARQQVVLVETQVRANQGLLELVNMRHKGGEATALDVLQQRQQLAGTEALLPRARGQRTAAEQAMNVLLGRAPGGPLPDGLALPAVGTAPPSPDAERLVTDRPDLAQAIATLDAARLQRTAAFLGLAPTLGVTSSVGRQYLHMEETDHVDTWSVGGALSIPLFGGGRTHAGIRAATAQQAMAAEALRGRVLSVIQQLGTAQARDAAAAETLAAIQRQRDAAADAYTESESRYRQGLTPYINVLMALNAHQGAELSLLDAQRNHLRTRVQLHTAVGGSWSRFAQEATP
jgi:outer membrane protein TolC